MGRMWWLLLNAFAISVICAAPRELTTDELITKPRPGEEYVHIQTSSKDKIDLVDKSFTTSHRIPELSKSNRSEDFQTSHKIPHQAERTSRSLSQSDLNLENPDQYDVPASNQRVVFSVAEGTTNEPPLERVVTRTSIKMSKSKKVQKSVVKVAHDGLVDIKADEGLIDERPNVDEEEREIMKKKFLKSEKVESTSEEFSPPTRFNVPFEDEEKAVDFDTAHLIIPNPVIATTQEPPITTFNYKNVYDKTRKSKGFVTNSESTQDKYKYETVSNESIKTAESKTITSKKDTKQDKKDIYVSKDKEESGFYLLPVNKQQPKFKDDNYDFVDVEEKVLVPAGSSPSQSSRINIKKGPNGQEYEYEYVYYYYDDDEDSPNSGNSPKEGKVVASTTEKIYNGHDGPTKEDQEQNSVQSTSTNGNKYLPTESPKPALKVKPKSQIEVNEEVEEDTQTQNFVSKGSRSGNNGSSRFSSSGRQSESSRQSEPTNNEVYFSSGRSQSRSRGRGSGTAAATEEEIPAINEERLPANTRFPPRSRSNNAPATSPQPQETTTRTRSREGNNQSRLRIPNLGLLDSSSFKTHASDASIEDDALRDPELQRKANARGLPTETSYRRGTRPATASSVEVQDVPAVTRRPAIRKPVEDRRSRPTAEGEEEVVEEKRYRPPVEEERILRVPQEEAEKRPRVPLEEEIVRRPKVPLEEEREVRRPHVPFEGGPQEEQQFQKDRKTEKEFSTEITAPEERRPQPQTTRESDAEEGVFESSEVENTSGQTVTDQSRNPEVRTNDFITEDPSVPGLTQAMMEKVALDLYAILQQAQNENIRTNFIDGNSTDVTTDLGEGQTEFSTDDVGSTVEPSTTTTTTTTTTTPTTATTTTTTTPAPTPAPGRGRYRGRVANGNKGRAKVSTTTTTEPAEEATSARTRGRFQPSHGTRGSGLTFARKPSKPVAREPIPEEAPVSEETSRAAPERSFGERPRSRFRTSGKVTTSAPSTTVPSAPAGAAGSRGNSVDRFNSRRRGGGRAGLPQTQHSATEAHAEEERQETHQEPAGVAEEAPPSAPLRPTRPRIGGSIRPLRPGPRAPLLLPQRGHQAVVSSTTTLPAEHEETEKEISEPEIQQPQEDAHEGQTTPVGDALTRLKSRPRLRIGANANHQRPQTPPPPPPQNRRKLVSTLLPKRKPTEEKPVEKVDETEERIVPEEIPVEDLSPLSVEPSNTTAEPEAKGLSGLLAGKRRNLNRRPGTIYSRAKPAEA